jgi:dTDP-4-dehydrorhamnose reductase
MLRLAKTRDQIAVVADQRGTSTSALAIADGVIAIVKNLLNYPNESRLRGVFHMTTACGTTWAGFAKAIFEASSALGGPVVEVKGLRRRNIRLLPDGPPILASTARSSVRSMESPLPSGERR